MRRPLRMGVLACVVLLLSLSVVSAWGVNPARQRAEHLTDTQYLSVTLENPQRVEGYFRVSFSGELAPYAKYTGPVIYVSPDDPEYIVPFTLRLPEELMPGMNKLSVNLEQISGGGTGTVSSLITLVADVNVEVPVQGNHVLARLAIARAEIEDPTVFTISVFNKGEAAAAVWADIVIKGPTNAVIDSWSTEKTVIEFQGNGKIVTQWEGTKEPGLYYVEVTLHHDDQVQLLRQTFMVGSKEVVSENIGSDAFDLGRIVPLRITARNLWNEEIGDVFAEVFVLSEKGAILQSFKTPSESIGPLSRAVLTGFWDTANIVVGAYDLNVIMHFEDGQSQQSYPVVVKSNKLEVADQVTGQVTGEREASFSQNTSLIILVAILVIVIIILIQFRRSRKK